MTKGSEIRGGLKLFAVCADKGEMDISAIALQGLQQADAQLEQAASSIASLGASSAGSAGPDIANFTAEALSLISAQNQTAVNVATLKVADEMQKTLIDLTA